MSDFPWAYIDAQSSLSASGPTGSVQFRARDAGKYSTLTGSHNFMFHTASGVLAVSGTMEVSGTVTANQINVLSQSVVTSHFSASGNTKFGDTTDDTHQFTGTVIISGGFAAGNDTADAIRITGSDTAAGTPALELTGSAQSMLVLNGQNTDALKDIVFKKAGTTQASIGVNSDEHFIIENESTKDLIIRTQNQNTIRIFGNQQAVEINGAGVTANATLDVNGNTNITSSLTVSGTVAFGDRRHAASGDTLGGGVVSVLGTLTASKGIHFGEAAADPIFISLDKKILFTGSAVNASASFMSSSGGHFSISGSRQAGTILRGGKLTLDHKPIFGELPERGLVVSGAIGGPGSFLGVDNTGRIILTPATMAEVPGGDETIQFNEDGSFSGSANLQFDYDDNELSLVGTLEVKSGSSPASAPIVFAVDGEDGITAGRTKLKLVEAWTANTTNRLNTSKSNQDRFKYMKNTNFPTTGGETSYSNDTTVLMPNAGRLTKILYRFDHDASGGGSPTFNAATEFRIEMHVAPVTQNGTTPNSTTKTIHQATASFAGPNVVGGIDLLRDERVTGSWGFDTGSMVGVIMKTSNTNTALGTGFQTYLFEFDHFAEYVSGSGN